MDPAPRRVDERSLARRTNGQRARKRILRHDGAALLTRRRRRPPSARNRRHMHRARAPSNQQPTAAITSHKRTDGNDLTRRRPRLAKPHAVASSTVSTISVEAWALAVHSFGGMDSKAMPTDADQRRISVRELASAPISGFSFKHCVSLQHGAMQHKSPRKTATKQGKRSAIAEPLAQGAG